MCVYRLLCSRSRPEYPLKTDLSIGISVKMWVTFAVITQLVKQPENSLGLERGDEIINCVSDAARA